MFDSSLCDVTIYGLLAFAFVVPDAVASPAAFNLSWPVATTISGTVPPPAET